MPARAFARFGLLAAALAASGAAAAAEPLTMKRGTALMLFWQGGCGGGRKPAFTLAQAPAHGRIETSALPADRIKCRGGEPRGQLVAVVYRPDRDFVGTDRFALAREGADNRRLVYEVRVE